MSEIIDGNKLLTRVLQKLQATCHLTKKLKNDFFDCDTVNIDFQTLNPKIRFKGISSFLKKF